MAVVSILDVANTCNLDIDARTLGRIEVQANCPFCSPDDRNRHLYLNTEQNKFFCQRCRTGGDSVRLYALINSMDERGAFKMLSGNTNVYVSAGYESGKQVKQYPIRPLNDRHDVYLDFLSMLTLSYSHRRNLRERGLNDSIITGNLYRSVPLNRIERERVINQLLILHNLEGIPGFYYDDKQRVWKMTARAGFFIPVCTKDNKIQGIQIRLDDVINKKYRWFSSSKYENGCGAKGWIHVTGNTGSDVLCLTEGGLKADIASALSNGALFAARPGSGALYLLEDTLRELSPQKIVICDDMDRLTNPQVREDSAKAAEIARKYCSELEVFSWDTRFKGIDDYLLYRRNYITKTAA